jgi:glutamate:Na+ symporter, ESS family
MTPIFAFVWISAALILGKLLRLAVPALRRYFIPTSVLAGLVLLLVGPEVWGRISGSMPGGPFGAEVYEVWRTLPGFLINVVFASLFLGKALPSVREIWRRAGPQVAFGQSIAWGQYVVGIGVTMALLVPLFGVSPMFGALLEIGFEGGHGTAAGLGATFAEVGWAEGQDLALAVATVGVVMGVLLGMVLINWGIARGHTRLVTTEGRARRELAELAEADDAMEERESHEEERSTVAFETVSPLAFHIAYIGVAIGVGYAYLRGLIWLETVTLTRLGAPPLFEHVPLFPLAMIGGITVQVLRDRFAPGLGLDRQLVTRIQGVALDFLIVSAMATLMLSALAENWAPLLILIVAGLVFNVAMFVFLARRIVRDYWFERAIGDFGQSIGMTATGLLLMKVVDPDHESPAFEAFGYKQLLFEPVVGGGIFTAMSIPLIFTFGPWPVFALAGALCAFWITFGILVFGRAR